MWTDYFYFVFSFFIKFWSLTSFIFSVDKSVLLMLKLMFVQDQYLYQSTSCPTSSRWVWLWFWCAILWWLGLVTIFLLCSRSQCCNWCWRWIWNYCLLFVSWCCCSCCEEIPWIKRWWGWVLVNRWKRVFWDLGEVINRDARLTYR